MQVKEFNVEVQTEGIEAQGVVAMQPNDKVVISINGERGTVPARELALLKAILGQTVQVDIQTLYSLVHRTVDPENVLYSSAVPNVRVGEVTSFVNNFYKTRDKRAELEQTIASVRKELQELEARAAQLYHE